MKSCGTSQSVASSCGTSQSVASSCGTSQSVASSCGTSQSVARHNLKNMIDRRTGKTEVRQTIKVQL